MRPLELPIPWVCRELQVEEDPADVRRIGDEGNQLGIINGGAGGFTVDEVTVLIARLSE
ncbi:MAG: hypothetical protein ACI9K5_001630 [Gammaproteobacteria bacterium]